MNQNQSYDPNNNIYQQPALDQYGQPIYTNNQNQQQFGIYGQQQQQQNYYQNQQYENPGQYTPPLQQPVNYHNSDLNLYTDQQFEQQQQQPIQYFDPNQQNDNQIPQSQGVEYGNELDDDMEDDYGNDDDDDEDEEMDLLAFVEKQKQLGLTSTNPASSNKISISFGGFNAAPKPTIVIPTNNEPEKIVDQQVRVDIQPQIIQDYQQETQPNNIAVYDAVQQPYSQFNQEPIQEFQTHLDQYPQNLQPLQQNQNVPQQIPPYIQNNEQQIQEQQEIIQPSTNKIKISFGLPQASNQQAKNTIKIAQTPSTIQISQNPSTIQIAQNPTTIQIAQQQSQQIEQNQTFNQFEQLNVQDNIAPISSIHQNLQSEKPEDIIQPQFNNQQQQPIVSTQIYQDQQPDLIQQTQPVQIRINDQQLPPPVYYEQEMQMQQQNLIPQPDQQQQIPLQEKPDVKKKTKKSEKKKKRKKKSKGQLIDFYNLDKTKLTLEIDHIEMKMRAQALFTFRLKDEETVNQKLKIINEEQNYKKHILEQYIHAKQMHVYSVHKLNEDGSKDSILFDYPQPDQQATFLKDAYENQSKDLHTFETQQQAINENNQKEPLLQIKNIITLKCGSDDIKSQLKPKIRIMVEYMLEKITNFGIQANKFKQSYDQNGQSIEDTESTYFFTKDLIDQNELWMPIIQTTKRVPQKFVLNYLAPKNFFVVSSGKLIDKQTEKEGLQRTLFVYSIDEQEKSIPDRIGFIMGKFTNIHKIQDLNEVCSGGATALFTSPKRYESFTINRLYEKNVIYIINYLQKLIQAQYPYSSLKIVFVPNLILKSARKQSLDFAGGLHILDEELIFNRNQLENRNATYKYLASSLAFDFFGGKVFEESFEDWWLLQGLRESLGNHFKIAKCGILLYRYNIMQTIQNLYKQMKYGFERYPLSSQSQPHPAEQQLNDIVYQKCELIMHMIESMIDKSYYERIIRQLYDSANPTISQGLFHNIFKQVCGFKLKQFFQNWIISTSCPKLTASFNYNKRNNSLDLNIAQTSAMKTYFAYKNFTKTLIENNQIFTTPFSFRHIKHAMQQSQSIDKFFVELKRGCIRYFTGEVNVMIYLTDGAEIQTQQQKMSLKYGKSQVSVNIPLQCKVKKTIQNKKKEYENMLMYDQEMHQDDERGDDTVNNHGQNDHHLIDNMQWKFGLNDFELEDYPYGTKNLFDVKNLESPVLWIRVDPDMEFIRKVKVVQEQNNWLFQLLQEKDIIGQIEAIKELNKFNSELVYEILKSVSTNENYFFKVRKVAIKKLQLMQTSQFNKYLSHEKFLIKVFNQRNFDKSIGFYKSNDFTKVLEYYIDKSILKILSKCKEVQFELKPEIKEYLLNQQKLKEQQQNQSAATDPNQPSGTISINVTTSEIQQKKNNLNSKYDEKYFAVSSEQIAQLLMRLLQENDNSENPFDDSFYIKQILKALGNLDCFKLLPEIATEIYRQYRLDYIGKYSPQFSITKGSIAGYFKLRKQIYLFRKEKSQNIDTKLENLQWYNDQIEQAGQQTLNQMGKDLDKMLKDDLWPFEVKSFVQYQNIKHCFLYQNNHFLKALYIQLKNCEEFITKNDYKHGINIIKQMALFLENNQDLIDFRESFLDNEKSKVITQLIWNMLLLPFNFLNPEFCYWMKHIYYFIYGNELPPFLKDEQAKSNAKVEILQYDEYWSRFEDQLQDASGVMQQQSDDKDRHLKQILAQKGNTSIALRTQPKNDKIIIQDIGALNQIKQDQQPGEKLKIVLAPFGNEISRFNQNQSINNNQTQDKSIKIVLGGLQTETFKPSNLSNYDQIQQQQQQQYREEQQQLMQSLHHQPLNNQSSSMYYDGDDYNDDNESVYDEFAEIKYELPWMQAAWEILGTLWYHEEAGAFLQPVSEDDLGEYYEEYMRTIDYPMDFGTIKLKMVERLYTNFQEFKRDVITTLKNCQKFNHESSEIHQASAKLERFFKQKLNQYRQFDQQPSMIRIT